MKKITIPSDNDTMQEIVLPEGFSAGFSRVDITPSEYPFYTFGGRKADTVGSRVYTTCVVVSDGEKLAFFLTSDVRAATPSMVKPSKEIIQQMTGTDEDHIFFCTTHNHSGPDIGKIDTDETAIRWLNWYITLVPGLIKEALLDLSPASITIGRTETERLNFVRRYWLADGTFMANRCRNTSKAPYVSHESIADPEMRVIRFCREGKKDIVMANWQAHAASDAGLRPTELTADYVHEFRKTSEEKYGVHFAFYNGACGDVVTGSKVIGEQPYQTMDELGVMLADALGNALKDMQPANPGPIRTASEVIHAPLKEVSEDTIAKAREVAECTDAEKRTELRKKYNFENRMEANSILNTVRRRGIYGDTIPIRHVAISFGDIGFALAPFEMFHANGKQARDGSPFPMTFICANTDGGMSYVPTIEAVPNGGYEVYNSSVIPGTGERCAQTMAKLLQQTKK